MESVMFSVLVMDDEIEIVDLITREFTKLGNLYKDRLEIFGATNAKDAIRVLQKHPINALVIDYHFRAGMNGYEFIEMIKPKFTTIKQIVMISGQPKDKVMTAVIDQLSKSTVKFKYLPKPLDSRRIEEIYFYFRENYMSKTEIEKYIDFELFVDEIGRVRATCSEVGEASGDPIPVQHYMDKVETFLTLVSENTTNENILRGLGKELYQMIFSEKINVLFRNAETIAQSKNKLIRIRLKVDCLSLEHLPWELMYDDYRHNFFVANPSTVLSRYLDVSLPQRYISATSDALRILVIISSPSDQYPLDADQWENIILESLQEPIQQRKIVTRIVKLATREEIDRALMSFSPNVIQFVGHGVYKDKSGYLALVKKDTSGTWLVDDVSFADMFLGHFDKLGLVCLAACDSAKSDSPKGFLGVAPKLVEKGVPAVIAMQYPILISSAQIFLKSFYSALANAKPVDWAMQNSRKAILLEVGRGSRDFATPVLYMRAKEGRIFYKGDS